MTGRLPKTRANHLKQERGLSRLKREPWFWAAGLTADGKLILLFRPSLGHDLWTDSLMYVPLVAKSKPQTTKASDSQSGSTHNKVSVVHIEIGIFTARPSRDSCYCLFKTMLSRDARNPCFYLWYNTNISSIHKYSSKFENATTKEWNNKTNQPNTETTTAKQMKWTNQTKKPKNTTLKLKTQAQLWWKPNQKTKVKTKEALKQNHDNTMSNSETQQQKRNWKCSHLNVTDCFLNWPWCFSSYFGCGLFSFAGRLAFWGFCYGVLGFTLGFKNFLGFGVCVFGFVVCFLVFLWCV